MGFSVKQKKRKNNPGWLTFLLEAGDLIVIGVRYIAKSIFHL